MRKENSTNSKNRQELITKCSVLHAMEQLNGRWKILLIWYIHLGLNRFGLIRKQLPSLTTKMLSQQIKELESDGLITKTIFAEMPPRVEYAITKKAKTLIPIMEMLKKWGDVDKQAVIKKNKS